MHPPEAVCCHHRTVHGLMLRMGAKMSGRRPPGGTIRFADHFVAPRPYAPCVMGHPLRPLAKAPCRQEAFSPSVRSQKSVCHEVTAICRVNRPLQTNRDVSRFNDARYQCPIAEKRVSRSDRDLSRYPATSNTSRRIALQRCAIPVLRAHIEASSRRAVQAARTPATKLFTSAVSCSACRESPLADART
jgi:hypothetical protein